jgi:hypothetical protein
MSAVLSDGAKGWASSASSLSDSNPPGVYILGIPGDYTNVLTAGKAESGDGVDVRYEPYKPGNSNQWWAVDGTSRLTNFFWPGYALTAIDGADNGSRLKMQPDATWRDKNSQRVKTVVEPTLERPLVQSAELLPPQPHLKFSGTSYQTQYYTTPEMQGSGINRIPWSNLCKPETVTTKFAEMRTDAGLAKAGLVPFTLFGTNGPSPNDLTSFAMRGIMPFSLQGSSGVGKVDALQLVDELEAIVVKKHAQICPGGMVDFNQVERIARNIGELLCVESKEFNGMVGMTLNHLLARKYKLF